MADLVANLNELGHQVALLTTSNPDSPVGRDGYAQVWRIETKRPGRYSSKWWIETSRPAGWWDWNPQLIIGIGDSAASLIGRAEQRRVPIVSHNHGVTVDEIRSGLSSRSARGIAQCLLNLARTPHRARSLRRYTQIWSVSDALVQQLQARPYCVPPEKIRHLPNTVDPELFAFDAEARHQIRSDVGVNPETFLGVFAGRLDRQKGADLAIEAVLRTKNQSLLVIGEGPSRKSLEERVRRRAAANRVFFSGRVDPTDMPKYLSAADYMIFPTRRLEGFPMITLEAAASGLPIVSTLRARVPKTLNPTVIPAPSVVNVCTAIEQVRPPVERANGLPRQWWSSENISRLQELVSCL